MADITILADQRHHFQAQTSGGEYYVVAETKIGRRSGEVNAAVYRQDGSRVTSATYPAMGDARRELLEGLAKLQAKVDATPVHDAR